MIEILLGGLVGAIIASILVIIYEEFKFSRSKNMEIAREKFEKLYSPLNFFIENSRLISENDDGRSFSHSNEEGKLIDNIIFNYYYLADEDLRSGIFTLYSTSRYKSGKYYSKDVIPRISQGYNKYRKKLGLS